MEKIPEKYKFKSEVELREMGCPDVLLNRILANRANAAKHQAKLTPKQRAAKNKLAAETNRNRNGDKMIWCRAIMGDKCVCCGYDTTVTALEFHHVDESKKDFEISTAISSRLSGAAILKELAKCVLVCANCHREIHAGVRKLYAKHLKSFKPERGFWKGWDGLSLQELKEISPKSFHPKTGKLLRRS